MSLLDNHQLKIVTNAQVTIKWYQSRMTSLQEGTQVIFTYITRGSPAQTFHGSHLLNRFAEQQKLHA